MFEKTIISRSGLEFLCLDELNKSVSGGEKVCSAPWHSSILAFPEVSKVYNAVAYAMYKYGIVMNVHMTVNWRKLGIVEPGRAIAVLSEFNSNLAKWLRVGKPTIDPCRIGRRYGRNSKHVYVYVHENGPVEGFHSHQLCFVHPTIRREFKIWAHNCLSRFSPTGQAEDGALDIQLSCLQREDQKVERCWSAFRYVTKQLKQDIEIIDKDGEWYDARSVFKVWPFQALRPLPVKQAVFVSRNIDVAARKRHGFSSRLQTGDFADMYDGREIQEGRQDREKRRREAEAERMLDTIQD